MTYPNRIYTCVFLFLLLVFFPSCNPQPEARKLLLHAEHFADTEQVDSGLRLIDSIFYPEKSFDKENYMRYLVTRVRLRYKGLRDIKADTAVFAAWRYYKKETGMSRDIALAAFYSGCVYREQGLSGKAMHAYSEAMDQALKTNDNNLKGLVKNNIGGILLNENLYQQALKEYRQAAGFYAAFPNNKIQSLSAIGKCYLLMNEVDSGISVFRQGLSLAIKTKSKPNQSLLMQNLSIAYSEKEDYAQSFSYLKKSFALNADSTSIPCYLLNFGDIYARMGDMDSAHYYYGKVRKQIGTIKDGYLKLSILHSLARMEREDGNFKEQAALKDEEIDVYTDIMEQSNNNRVIDAMQKYNFELLKNSHQKEANRYLFWLVCLLCCIIVAGAGFFRYAVRKHRLEVETKDKIAMLTKMATEMEYSHSQRLAAKEQNLRDLLLWKFDVVTKSALLQNGETEKLNASQLIKKFHRIVYGGNEEGVWDSIVALINLTENNLWARLQLEFPGLSNEEYRICVLSYAGMNIKETSVILGLGERSVQAHRTRLRQKIGLNDSKSDMGLFLKQKLKGHQ
jgi:tetratricopeptide (TPR) repeat protein